MNATELQDLIADMLEQELTDTVKIDELLRIYAQAKEAVFEYQKVMDAAKYHVNAAMKRLGLDVFSGESGEAKRTFPYSYPAYDTKALEVLRSSSDDVARLLDPHRKIVDIASGIRITVKKGDRRA